MRLENSVVFFKQNAVLFALLISITLAILLTAFFSSAPNFEFLFAFLLFSPPSLAFFYGDYLREKRLQEIESSLPTALFQISSFPPMAPIEKLVDSIAESNYGALSQEFLKASKQIRSGYSVKEALRGVSERSGSLLLERVVSLLLVAQEAGSDVSKALREIAEDVFKLSAISRETAAATALHKYTLIAAGAFIIPGVLGLLFSATSSFNTSSLAEFCLGSSKQAQQDLKQTIFFANQFYLIVFSLLSSSFISLTEGSSKKFVLYAAFLLPCSLLVFSIASALSLS